MPQLHPSLLRTDSAHDPLPGNSGRVFATAQTTWIGLMTRVLYFSLDNAEPLSLPALAEDQLIVKMNAQAHAIQGKLVRQFNLSAIGTGSTFLIPHGEPVAWQRQGHATNIVFLFEPNLFAQLSTAMNHAGSAPELTPQVAVADPLIYQISLALLGEMQSGGLFGRLYAESLVQTLALHLLRTSAVLPRSLPVVPGGLSIVARRHVIDYIHLHLAQALTINELAALVYLSPYHFMRLFKATMGQTVHQYVITQRVEAGKQLLLAGDLTIAQIAQQIGFTDQSHFAHHFKRLVGVAPSLLLKDHRNV
ncbi:hypothetical protein BH10CHL1_BH10CHL1_49360 [soil metagenome]